MVKVAGHERSLHRGPARVFNSEEEAMAAVTTQQIKDAFARRIKPDNMVTVIVGGAAK